MRLYPQMYSGSSLLPPATGPSGNVPETWDASIFKPLFVRSTTGTENTLEPMLDFAAIERKAREAQSAWIASTLKSWFKSLMRKLQAQPGYNAPAARNHAKKKAARISAD